MTNIGGTILDAVETTLDDNCWRIDGAIANLDFIVEYCEANNTDSFDDKIRQRDEVILQMRKNRLARKNRISVVKDNNVSNINHE